MPNCPTEQKDSSRAHPQLYQQMLSQDSYLLHGNPSKSTERKPIPVTQTLKIEGANITQFDGNKILFNNKVKKRSGICKCY